MSFFVIWSQVMLVKVGHLKIWGSYAQKVLGIITDQNFKFNKYILTQCKKAGKKQCISTSLKCFSLEHRRTLMKAFIELLLFVYCPLIWMFCQPQKYGI